MTLSFTKLTQSMPRMPQLSAKNYKKEKSPSALTKLIILCWAVSIGTLPAEKAHWVFEISFLEVAFFSYIPGWTFKIYFIVVCVRVYLYVSTSMRVEVRLRWVLVLILCFV